MKKVKDKDIKGLSILLGFAATLMIFLPALIAPNSDEAYTGMQVVFGYDFIDFGSFAGGALKFSIINFVAFLLPLIASLLLLSTKKNNFLSTVLFAAGAVLLFMVSLYTVVTITLFGNVTTREVDWQLGIGLTLAIIFSALGFLLGVYRHVRKA